MLLLAIAPSYSKVHNIVYAKREKLITRKYVICLFLPLVTAQEAKDDLVDF